MFGYLRRRLMRWVLGSVLLVVARVYILPHLPQVLAFLGVR